jgi:hypothetical protein
MIREDTPTNPGQTNPGQTNPGHDKPWTRQTLDTTNPGQNRTGGMHTWQCKLRFSVHNFTDFSLVLNTDSTPLLNVPS